MSNRPEFRKKIQEIVKDDAARENCSKSSTWIRNRKGGLAWLRNVKWKKPRRRKPPAVEAPRSDDIVDATRLKPADEGYAIAKRGVEALLAQLVEPGRTVDKVSNAVIDEFIAEIDQKLSAQLDAILHNPEVQKLESAWRSLKFWWIKPISGRTSKSKS
jgi:hypothetical protein